MFTFGRRGEVRGNFKDNEWQWCWCKQGMSDNK